MRMSERDTRMLPEAMLTRSAAENCILSSLKTQDALQLLCPCSPESRWPPHD